MGLLWPCTKCLGRGIYGAPGCCLQSSHIPKSERERPRRLPPVVIRQVLKRHSGIWFGCSGKVTAKSEASVYTIERGNQSYFPTDLTKEEKSWSYHPNRGTPEADLRLSNVGYAVPVGFPVAGSDVFSTRNRDVQMVTAGVNYLFNWAN
jgi:hypothetical protein